MFIEQKVFDKAFQVSSRLIRFEDSHLDDIPEWFHYRWEETEDAHQACLYAAHDSYFQNKRFWLY